MMSHSSFSFSCSSFFISIVLLSCHLLSATGKLANHLSIFKSEPALIGIRHLFYAESYAIFLICDYFFCGTEDGNAWESVPDLEKVMYLTVKGFPCVRLLNVSGEIGCSSELVSYLCVMMMCWMYQFSSGFKNCFNLVNALR